MGPGSGTVYIQSLSSLSDFYTILIFPLLRIRRLYAKIIKVMCWGNARGIYNVSQKGIGRLERQFTPLNPVLESDWNPDKNAPF